MNKISCDVCLVLIHNLKDNVATQGSKKLVKQNI